MKIKITQEHINKGLPYSPGSCPIALAIKDAIAKDIRVSVNYDLIALNYGYDNQIHTPRSCQRFIKRFDERKKVEPFTTIIKIPEHYLKGKTNG